MQLRIFHILCSRPKSNIVDDSKDKESYVEEHKRLEMIISSSEDIWEARTYQIAAGGLSISFAIFTYLMSNGIHFSWHMIFIWSLFAVSLLLNYVSHRITICIASNMQELLSIKRNNNESYDETELNAIYKSQDMIISIINLFVGLLLCSAIVYTIIFTCLELAK